jgi:predicted nicotinamide N-methyase
MHRHVEPEWLDELPPTDPRAAGSRRDLQRLNRLMGHASAFARTIHQHTDSRAALSLVELGAGDGTFLLQLARRLPRSRNVQATLVDRLPAVTDATLAALTQLGWPSRVAVSDVFAWLNDNSPKSSVIMANLFLHHFEPERLRELLHRIAERAELFVACEPRRGPLPWLASRCLAVVGCNAVTRHDAVISVRAGFTGRELSALWPNSPPQTWRLEERPSGLFSHLFVARRR